MAMVPLAQLSELALLGPRRSNSMAMLQDAAPQKTERARAGLMRLTPWARKTVCCSSAKAAPPRADPGARHGELGVAVEAAEPLPVEVQGRVELAHLRSDLGGEGRGVEAGDPIDGGALAAQPQVEATAPAPDGCDRPDAGDDHLSLHTPPSGSAPRPAPAPVRAPSASSLMRRRVVRAMGSTKSGPMIHRAIAGPTTGQRRASVCVTTTSTVPSSSGVRRHSTSMPRVMPRTWVYR